MTTASLGPESLASVLTDVTVREGSQQEHDIRGVSVGEKLKIVELQKEVGIRSAELTAFAPGEWFKDADELAGGVKELSQSIELIGLYFNIRGGERLLQFPHLHRFGIFHTAATESYRKKNYNQQSIEEVFSKLQKFTSWFQENSLQFDVLLVSTVFGGTKEGVLSADESFRFISELIEKGSFDGGSAPEQITLADTEGVANERVVTELVARLKDTFPEVKLCLHLHPAKADAQGLIRAGLDAGVHLFEGAWLSMGGSPFADKAGGNKAGGNLDIRDLIAVFEEKKIPIGLNLEKAEELEAYLTALRKK